MSVQAPSRAAWPAVRPLLVGERLNAQGSRRCRRLLLAEDHEGLLTIACEQLAHGAHALDVCVTLEPGSGIADRASASEEHRAEAARMIALVTRLAAAVEVPLFLDSADSQVLRAALPHVGARAVANSITLAQGNADAEATVPAVLEHGARLVALCIDEQGMALSTARKVEVAQRLHGQTKALGLDPRALIIDPLTFPLADSRTDRRGAAAATLAAVPLVKDACPEVRTVLGISDVSFGMPPAGRPVLNAVFLHHAVASGLDVAIVNVMSFRPYDGLAEEDRELAEDLIFDRRPDAIDRFVAAFAP
jgi:5-methyltetrahydrofolate--homocysteine methyltransferase